MRKEAQRWLRQAEADLAAARASLQAEHYEWACFQAQQSAEKALKAFLYEHGLTSIMTHSLKELVAEGQKIQKGLSAIAEEAKYLDLFYIPTRCPNSLAGNLAPAEFYDRKDAEKCLSSSGLIWKSVKSFISG